MDQWLEVFLSGVARRRRSCDCVFGPRDQTRVRMNNEVTGKMPYFPEQLKRADEFAQQVVNAWGSSFGAANERRFSPEFTALCELAFRYQDEKHLNANHRMHNISSESETAQEDIARESFVRAYVEFCDKHEPEIIK
jgi:hypothetical protein